jgi:hypothetical protein
MASKFFGNLVRGVKFDSERVQKDAERFKKAKGTFPTWAFRMKYLQFSFKTSHNQIKMLVVIPN